MRTFKLFNVFVGNFNLTFLIILFFIISFFILVGLFRYTDVTFICDNDYAYICTTVLFYLFKPSININKTFFICEIKNDEDSVCTFIICFSDSSISFLTSSVPNLKPYCTFIYLKSSKSKINTNSCYVVFLVIIILYRKRKLKRDCDINLQQI